MNGCLDEERMTILVVGGKRCCAHIGQWISYRFTCRAPTVVLPVLCTNSNLVDVRTARNLTTNNPTASRCISLLTSSTHLSSRWTSSGFLINSLPPRCSRGSPGKSLCLLRFTTQKTRVASAQDCQLEAIAARG